MWKRIGYWADRKPLLRWPLVVGLPVWLVLALATVPGVAEGITGGNAITPAQKAEQAVLLAEVEAAGGWWAVFWSEIWPVLLFWAVVAGFIGFMVGLGRSRSRRQNTNTANERAKQLRRDDQVAQVWDAPNPHTAIKEMAWQRGGGAFLGTRWNNGHREFVCAHTEASVMVLAPPRSGKTTGVILPSAATAKGAVVITSTKRDVLDTTLSVRQAAGRCWLFDPSGETIPPPGVTPLRWSPVVASGLWDEAIITARAMASTVGMNDSQGTSDAGSHFTDKAATLLAPMLYAAHHADLGMPDVADWVNASNLTPALELLDAAALTRDDFADGAHLAAATLRSAEHLADKERSAVFSTAQRACMVYLMQGPRLAAADPNFNVSAFVRSTDTVYVVAEGEHQQAAAPIIVGLLSAIKRATYTRQAMVTAQLEPYRPPVVMLLDEAANIAPIQDLPRWLSDAGGNGLHIVVVFQELSQPATRWGSDVADGLLTLCTTTVVLGGIRHQHTLRALSEFVGNYDREMVSQSSGWSQQQVEGWVGKRWVNAPSASTTYSVQRQARLEPGDIAQLELGTALVLDRNSYEVVTLSRWHDRDAPWKPVTMAARNQWQPAN